MSSTNRRPAKIIYPESDGKPLADNTKQYEWIVTIKGGLETLFQADPNVFVAGDLLWYPVEGEPKIRTAPDAMVIFGRPKGHRGSYLQWLENNIAPQVVFEVLSPSNTAAEMQKKRQFYERYGVEEYYVFDPDRIRLQGWLRNGDTLVQIATMQGWTSPLLNVNFQLDPTATDHELKMRGADGRLFLSYGDLFRQQLQTENAAEIAHREKEQAEQRFQQERRDKEQAEQRFQQERNEKEQLQQRLEQLLAQMKAADLKPEDE